MANVRDPAFWKRFSTAVHFDEEKSGPYAPPVTSRVKETNVSWVEHQQAKGQRWRKIGWLCFILLLLVAGGVAVLIWYLKKEGIF